MIKTVITVWLAALVLLITFVSLRVVVPALINLHNDGALILAVIVGGAAITAPVLFFYYARKLKL